MYEYELGMENSPKRIEVTVQKCPLFDVISHPNEPILGNCLVAAVLWTM